MLLRENRRKKHGMARGERGGRRRKKYKSISSSENKNSPPTAALERKKKGKLRAIHEREREFSLPRTTTTTTNTATATRAREMPLSLRHSFSLFFPSLIPVLGAGGVFSLHHLSAFLLFTASSRITSIRLHQGQSCLGLYVFLSP